MSDNSGGGRGLACNNVRLLSEILTCLRFLLKMRSFQVDCQNEVMSCVIIFIILHF